MISVTLAWREYICCISYMTLVTDLDAEAVSVIQDWITEEKSSGFDFSGFSKSEMFSKIGSVVQHISRRCTLKAIYTSDYGDFVSTHRDYINTKGFETLYIDFDRDDGVFFQIGTLQHYGPRTNAEGFLSLNPHLFNPVKRSKLKDPLRDGVINLFEDTLDIME